MGSFLVIGMGRFGIAVATELHQMKQEVLALDSHEDNIDDIINQVTNVVIGDAKDESVLRSIGVQNFDCVIVAIANHLEDSILITMILKELGAKMIVCKAQNERHAKILSMIGADKVVRPESDMGRRIAHSLVRKNIIDYFEISPDCGIIEIITPSQWKDKSILKNNLRRKYGITIVAIRSSNTERVSFSPSADAILHEGDILTVIGTKQNLDTISDL